ncbi:hypothetical protein LB506_013036 [Fusarium annulatum]|nr:hypothetical protein LB506_013036 [Fusarium annulatum]
MDSTIENAEKQTLPPTLDESKECMPRSQSQIGNTLPGTQHHDTCNCNRNEEHEQNSQLSTLQRNYFEVGWENGDQDPLCPRSFGKWRKWVIVFVISFASLCVTSASSIYPSTYTQMEADFGNSRIISTLGLSLFVLGIAIGSLFFGPFSEFYGRRPIYLISWSMYIICIVPEAIGKNVITVLVGRFLDGCSGSAFLSVFGGTAGDMFRKDELQEPMLFFTVVLFTGLCIGPLIGGFVNYTADWVWTYYVLLIWGSLLFLAIILLIPETCRRQSTNPALIDAILIKQKAKRLRKETGDNRWIAPKVGVENSIVGVIKSCVIRPFELLLFEPMCLVLCIFSSILLGMFYLFLGSFPLIFTKVYGFSSWQVGLTFCGILIGIYLAVTVEPIWYLFRHKYTNRRDEDTDTEGSLEPEVFLPFAILGSLLVPMGLFIFAWSCYPWVHWIVPITGSAVFGSGVLLVFTGIFTYLVHAYPQYAASALAANSFMRYIFSTAFPLFGNQMYEKFGHNWASSLLGFLTLAMMPFPYIFFRYGKEIRAKSRFAGSGDAD